MQIIETLVKWPYQVTKCPIIFLMDEENSIKSIYKNAKTIPLNAKGQMTVFFATTVLALITFIAFIVNIGIFVKAKINLQNAVDAAAYAGASVQARQLSNIGYLNWEMRNVYKEWMFKTYVLGNMSLDNVSGPSNDPVDLRMDAYGTTDEEIVDGYNIPSTCLDFSDSGDVAVCKKAVIIGLPRFASTDVLGMEETTDAFIDAIAQQKAGACANRTSINFLTNFLYSYNIPVHTVGETGSPQGLAAQAPEISQDRMGAFPAAFDLALRIRNLEAQVNRRPYQKICAVDSPLCDQKIGELTQVNGLSPADERIYKAFFSGFRNLGGTNCGDGYSDELKCSFTLSELAPRPPNLGGSYTLSNLLIPASKQSATQKYYLDLKLMPVNYATFFTMMLPVTTAGGYETESSNLTAESTAECVATKVGMPVPGYPLGFVKNPDVLTYYAVKGEAEFVGLFNPFASNTIKLSAYAAAKPFGGRIGPMLFNVGGGSDNTSKLKPRSAPHYKSSPYLSAFDNTPAIDRYGKAHSGGDFQEGMPIPGNYNGMPEQFWLSGPESAVGGWIEEGSIYFAIPNIPYDYPNGNPQDFKSYFAEESSIQVITPLLAGSSQTSKAGLYNSQIFEKLKSKLRGLGPDATVSVESIREGITLSRAPTLYDAHNYLIPTPEDLNKELGTDSYGVILSREPVQEIQRHKVYNMSLYAPLLSQDDPNALYGSIGDLRSTLQEYMAKQEPAIDKYRGAMNVAAKLVYDKNISSRTDAPYGLEAAKSLSDLGAESEYGRPAGEVYELLPDCRSTAGQFVWFFTGKSTKVQGDCEPDSTLLALMESYWSKIDGTERMEYHIEKFVMPPARPKEELFSAYRPGQTNDAQNGRHRNFLLGSQTNMSRNFYSTKFVTLRSISSSSGPDTFSGNFAVFSEGQRAKSVINDTSSNFKNYLEPFSFGIDISKIRH